MNIFQQIAPEVILDSLHDETVIADPDGTILSVNRAWREFCAENGGDTDSYYVGSNYFSICQGAVGGSSAEAQIVPDALKQVVQFGETFRCEYPCDSPTEKRWFEMIATRIQHNDKNHLVIHHRNISKRKLEQTWVEQAIVDSNILAALVATTKDAILSYDLDGNIISWNKAAEDLYGYTPDEVIGKSLEILYPENWPRNIEYYRDEILAGRLRDFEATRIAKNGAAREVWVSCAPVRGLSGEIIAISNIHRDVTEIRKAEKTRDLVAQEVIHRAKNMLSIVSAIQRQTAQMETTIEGFNQSFGTRIRSLSRTTDLLVEGSWTTVALYDLINGQMTPFTKLEDSRVTVSGPNFGLQPQAVQMIGMAIHELATNASKYGALTQDDGKIEITSEIVDGNSGKELNLRWHEICRVKDASKPTKPGFGRKVLEMLAPSMLDTTSRYTLADDHVIWTIDIPSDHYMHDIV